ncbi:pentatricopeptide repeat-containing protein At2g13600-like [Selaginella moellendorffii]|uniref:pentatricopeptide repeat-containing protein At2g13600-like n=1 Tax=Selaginella moellendorffii TaxID=88036 RepID=UPI000D1C9CE1|nr:pentatricopeptide repeat-containing protein At2g13600-like [Selaginella moellendorffii]|eukprot:XP_024537511.1 pentatricopeptide repeat-containing protein At2g13600-like [Selaginella moellendorffii]
MLLESRATPRSITNLEVANPKFSRSITNLKVANPEFSRSTTNLEAANPKRARTHIKLKTALEIVASLRKCRDLANGKFIHQEAFAAGFHTNKYIAAALIKMYGIFSSMILAQEVFDGMIHRDVVAWTSLILGYVENGESSRALNLFNEMDCEPDSFTFVAVLKALGCLAQESKDKTFFLERGIEIHKKVKAKRLESNVVVANTLVDMYGKCGNMKLAQDVFDKISRRDHISWNSLILGYAANGQSLHSLELFASMDCDPSSVSFVGALTACKSLACESEYQKEVCLGRGILIHKQASKLGFGGDIVVASALIDMYSKCGAMFLARKVFDTMKHRNVVTWNSLIWGYVENGESFVALNLYVNYMDCEPSYVTFVAVLKACGLLAKDSKSKKFYLEKGLAIHKTIRARGLESNVVVANMLIDMYCKCGSLENAKNVFDKTIDRDVVACNSLILGYAENAESARAIELFFDLGCDPSSVTYISALKACGNLASEKKSQKQFCLEKGILIHRKVQASGLESDKSISTTLVDMYSKCGSMANAREIFDKMPHPDVVTWTSLILAYTENGESLLALDVFARMDCEPDTFTYVTALKGCESLATLSAGQQIHIRICRAGLEQDQVVATALVDFYMKCGSMRRAEEIFNSMSSPDIISWNTLIAGYSSNGNYSQVFALAEQIRDGGVQMNGITLTCILMACSHMGLVREGNLYFEFMAQECGIESLDGSHYNCMVDLLGRSNMLEEALALVQSIPGTGADAVIWRTLLGSCKKWRNLRIARIAFDALVAAGGKDSADYILMSDIYASLTM